MAAYSLALMYPCPKLRRAVRNGWPPTVVIGTQASPIADLPIDAFGLFTAREDATAWREADRVHRRRPRLVEPPGRECLQRKAAR